MDKQATVEFYDNKVVGIGGPEGSGFGEYDEANGTYSLLPGDDWYVVGGVAFRGKPCETCDGTLVDHSGHDERPSCTCVAPCLSCHGLGVIPVDGSIQTGRSVDAYLTEEVGLDTPVLVLRLEGNGEA